MRKKIRRKVQGTKRRERNEGDMNKGERVEMEDRRETNKGIKKFRTSKNFEGLKRGKLIMKGLAKRRNRMGSPSSDYSLFDLPKINT